MIKPLSSLLLSFLTLGITGCFHDNASSQPSTSLKSREVLNKNILSEQTKGIILVKFKSNVTDHRKEELRKSIGAIKVPESEAFPFEKWEVTNISIEEAIKILEKQIEIDYVEPNFKYDLLQKNENNMRSIE